MKKVKILHCADLHFDTKMSNLNKQDLLDVFSNIIHIVKKEEVEIMLIAGDVFDNLSVNKQTLRFLELSFRSIPNVRVFISPGNHDPYNQKSFYKMVDWPDNVHIFKGEMEKVYIEDLDVNIYGAGFNANYIKESNLKIQVDEDKINIMVLHAEISNGTTKNEYNPVSLKDIENSNVDYLALGHRHSYSGINKQGKTYYAYSGCPQGRGFDELGDKGIIIGEVYHGGVNLDFKKTSKIDYLEKEINIDNVESYLEIKQIILNQINEKNRFNNIYKIILFGEIKDDFIISEDKIEQMLSSDFYFVKIIDRTEIICNYQELSTYNSIKGIFAKKILKEMEDVEIEEKELLKLAMKIGIKALTEEEVNISAY